MKSYLAAAVCMTSTPDVEANLNQAEELIELAVNQGAKLIGLPENFSFLGRDEEKIAQVDTIATKSEKFLIRMAQRFQVTILGGGFPTPLQGDRTKAYNTAMLVDANGMELGRYHKVHLFDVNVPDGNNYQESKTVMAGENLPPVCDTEELGKIGLSICYDVRFPEVFRHLSRQRAEIMFIPAAFTAYTGKDHWQVLLQARAIENTCYVIAPAQTGNHYARRCSHGHAVIVDPWGGIIASTGSQIGVAIGEINPQRLQQVRLQMPSLQHRVFS
ncbi:carbon-nitrogen hydrolase family protein [Cyanobacterium stanieri LEGE 03274]|uniref:Carbon-nitrogen hydrolase family protein n=1 Tax=Cyanobacterium stanieri LEGE 03274 TaxID=1828756 RepID=A0ABR9V3L3_9CHRO|nr:carbon-nitrogen hydrolase family protein [Cyanobacterium stanieri]MBE9222477.1 carbon-nitrogen hydrolase family protein [Cyanobacterium stanieri LEGE 03274]